MQNTLSKGRMSLIRDLKEKKKVDKYTDHPYPEAKRLNPFVIDLLGLGIQEIHVCLCMSVCWSVLCFFWDTGEKLSSRICPKFIFYS